MNRHSLRAAEINGDDAAWLRGQLPAGVHAVELDEVEFFGNTYDRAPGSGLYLPANDDVVERAIERHLSTAPEPEPPIGVDLFCGAGGFSLGIHQAGFDVVAAVEWDECAAHTYMCNLMHPDGALHFASDPDSQRWAKYVKKAKHARGTEWYGSAYRTSTQMNGGCRAFMFGDLAKVNGRHLMELAGVDHVDLVFGGPPCQGLSTANANACLEDPRNALLWEYMRIVSEINPGGFMIENAPALLTIAKGALFNALCAIANEFGYDVSATKVDAASYGVPQHRVRALVVGIRQGAKPFAFPMPTNWAIGRPVNETPWNIPGEDAPTVTAKPSARFDMVTRRWSFDGTATPTTIETVAPPIAQNELFGDAA